MDETIVVEDDMETVDMVAVEIAMGIEVDMVVAVVISFSE